MKYGFFLFALLLLPVSAWAQAQSSHITAAIIALNDVNVEISQMKEKEAATAKWLGEYVKGRDEQDAARAKYWADYVKGSDGHK